MKIENKIVWVDIPVIDLKRASEFYSHLMNLEFTIEENVDMKFALCPHKDNEAAFCLVVDPKFEPSCTNHNHILIYLNVNNRMDEALSEVTKHGGKILTAKEQIGPWGFRAIIMDSEGNRVGLHSY